MKMLESNFRLSLQEVCFLYGVYSVIITLSHIILEQAEWLPQDRIQQLGPYSHIQSQHQPLSPPAINQISNSWRASPYIAPEYGVQESDRNRRLLELLCPV